MPPLTIIKDPASLSKAVKERRKALRVTQGDVASLHDMSRFTLVDLELGSGDPKLSTITTIMEGLGLRLVVVPTNVVERLHIPNFPDDPPDDDWDLDLDNIDFGENTP